MKGCTRGLVLAALACMVWGSFLITGPVTSLALSHPKQICDETTKTKQKTFHGSFSLKNRSHDALSLFGTGEVENIIVTKQAKICGAYTIKNSVFADLKVDGFAQLDSVVVNNEFKGLGHIEVMDLKVTNTCQIDGSMHGGVVACPVIILTGKELALEKSTIGAITVSKSKKSRRAIITLLDTVVSGTVSFERNDGTVVLKGTSSVAGAVVGGIVTKGE